jgi:dTDP-4-amino-4,6-dideoxygalactose transaminase
MTDQLTLEVPFVDLAAEHSEIRVEVDRAWHEVVSEGHFVLGPRVAGFEREFARFVESDHAIGVANGGDALRLALLALGIGRGDEVIVPANSFIATALAATQVGATPVLVDCDSRTYLINVGEVEAAVTPRTRAVIPVHLTGQAADVPRLAEVASRRGLAVIEDAAQAHGATLNGRRCGSMGTAACFSFYPSKNLGAYGDGGIVTTSDDDLAETLRRLRSYGERGKYDHAIKGLNSRLDAVQAAILMVKLSRLEGWNAARARHAAQYRELVEGVGDVSFQEVAAGSSHVYHLFVIETAHRDALRDHLAEAGVETGIHYPRPIHLQEAYEDLRLPVGAFPESERLAGRMLSLPMYPQLVVEQIAYVARCIREFFGAPPV